ncbi:hypothetical protein MG293_015083, partial [Ovis ammon polii]
YFEYENLMSKLSRSLHQAFESLRQPVVCAEPSARFPLAPNVMFRASCVPSSTLRCQSRIARTLPADQKPECRPYWEKGDPSMPLPFDLTEIVSELRGLLLETRP